MRKLKWKVVILHLIFVVRQLEKARAAGNLTIDPSTAAILSTDPSILADDVLADSSLKTEDTILTVTNDTIPTDTVNDHDYGAVAKRMKTETWMEWTSCLCSVFAIFRRLFLSRIWNQNNTERAIWEEIFWGTLMNRQNTHAMHRVFDCKAISSYFVNG